MKYKFRTKDTCASEIHFEINDGIVSNIEFFGGCNGNLKAISTLLEGQKASYVVEKLTGLTCGRRPTSCADQLATAIANASENA